MLGLELGLHHFVSESVWGSGGFKFGWLTLYRAWGSTECSLGLPLCANSVGGDRSNPRSNLHSKDEWQHDMQLCFQNVLEVPGICHDGADE